MNRSDMRENAFKLIYSLEIQKTENIQEQIDLYFESNNLKDEEAKKYITDAVNGIEKNKQEILSDKSIFEILFSFHSSFKFFSISLKISCLFFSIPFTASVIYFFASSSFI